VDALTTLRFAALTGPDAEADALLSAHFDLMRAQSPAESCHVMTADDLRASGARVYLGRDAAGEAVAIGALKPLTDGAAELKSMHCRQDRRGQGLGRALLAHLFSEARATGLNRLWLETGSAACFAPARALYAAAGFTECPPFGDYVDDPLSVFMTRAL
jgi:putative acetyltransferase